MSLDCHFRSKSSRRRERRRKMKAMIKESGAAAVGPEQASSPNELGTILVVEDDPRMQRVLMRVFSAEHYTVVTAGDGQTGLDLFNARHPVAVVLDLILPHIS